MGTVFTKRKRQQCTCRVCKKKFKAADVKACFCPKCKQPKLCACGCGELTSSGLKSYRAGHHSKNGGSKSFRVGQKKRAKKICGKNNPACRSSKQLSRGVKRYWASLTSEQRKSRLRNNAFVLNPLHGRFRRQDGFLSRLEKKVAKILNQLKVAYDYEPLFRFKNNRRFFPDFVIEINNRKTIVEVTGFAYPSWQRQFIQKVKRIQESGFHLVCVTYAAKRNLLASKINTQVFSVKGFKRWLEEI